jgi:ribonuclease D
VQVAAERGALIGIIDVPALSGRLGGLGEILLDPAILKIVHAGGQDMEILTTLLGALPVNVYDTQVAAAFAGFSLQTGYGALVQSLLGVRLSKEEGFSDWSRRPLTESMLAYAENDVRFLHALHDKLGATLEARGRSTWAVDQTTRILTGAAEEVPPADLWRRIGGRSLLDPRGLAILRELGQWRDEEARRRDKPRRTVIKDEALIEVARRAPRTPQEVLGLRGMPPNLGERAADGLAERVRRGLAVPEEERPRVESAPPLDDQGAALVELLSAVVRARALAEQLPPALLASGDDLRSLVAGRRVAKAAASPLFSGWRGEIIGDSLRAVIAGELAVAWDAKEGRLVFRTVKEAS